MKNTKILKHRSILLYILGGLAWVAVIFAPKLSVNAAQSFIQSYSSNASLNQGLVVQLVPKSASEVEVAPQSTDVNAFGVVVNAADASVAFSSSSNTTQTYVATTGRYNVLVSDQNGPIGAGEYITVSSLDGVGMKDDNVQPIIVGQAAGAFNGTSGVISTATIKASNGKTDTVHLGLIPVNIDFRRNPLQQSVTGNVPSFLAKTSSSITGGKIVSPWRIYVGLAIIIAVAVISGVILYGGIKNSLISIGRNPLSKQPIIKALTEVTIVALIIFITGVFGVYLLLKLWFI